MVMVAGQLDRLAAALSERAAEVFTHVAVIDQRGTVLAATASETVGNPYQTAPDRAPEDDVRVPLRLGSETGEVVVAEPVTGDAISPHLTRTLVELMINQTLVVSRLPNQQELKSSFIHSLLRGGAADEAEAIRDGQILGMDLTTPRAVMLIDASHYILAFEASARSETREARSRRRAQVIIAAIVSFFNLPNDSICAYIGSGEIAVLKASSTVDLEAWADGQDAPGAGSSWANLTALKRAATDLLRRLRQDTRSEISVGIGRYHPGIRGLARSYEDALAALSLGLRLEGANKVHCLDGLGIAAFVGVSDQRTKVDLASHLLRPLDHEPDLLETVETFFDSDCCPSAAAGRLSIHRNTLSYRLDKISALTGLDPRHFNDAVQIRLALLLRSI
jgi:carbohydrate diacid regulator